MILKLAGSRYRVILLVIGCCLLAGLTVRFSEQVSSQQNGPAAGHVSSFRRTKGTERMLVSDAYPPGDPISQLKGSGPQVCETGDFRNPLPINPISTVEEESTLPEPVRETGTLEKMIAASGRATM